MNVSNAVYPERAQIQALLASGSAGKILMLNLLKFRPVAAYADGRATTLSGREAYQLYADQMVAFVEAKGGRVMVTAAAHQMVIGTADTLWDAVAVVEYPSAAAFVEIALSKEVAAFGVHREAGLEGQLLIQCSAT